MELMIIDYGMGNLRSVANAFEALGCEARISDNPEDLRTAKRIVLPGVGAFRDGIDNLRSGGWIDILEEEIKQGKKPFLGICLGMHLLATTSTEDGTYSGLGWIPGTVERIKSKPRLRIPHIGWNDVKFVKKNGIYSDMGDSGVFYFVHSYIICPKNSDIINGICTYGNKFAASIQDGNIFATQFHPEKSQKIGLSVLKNFLAAGGQSC